MSQKARENWGREWSGKAVTYVEDPRNPVDLVQMYGYKVVHDHIVNYLPNVAEPKIIEVGCGGARNSLYLALHGFDVTCSDYSQEALRLARANFDAFDSTGSFLMDDLMDSKIPDNSFDCVMSFGLLEHFYDLKPIIDSLTRILKPGGIHVHIVIPKKFSTQTIMNFVLFLPKLAINAIVRKQPLRGILRRSYRNFPHYENSFSWQEYCKAFEEGGNEVLKCEPGGLFLPFIAWPTHIGLGYPVVKLFQSQIIQIADKVKNSTSPLIYRLSQTYTIIGRKY